MSSSLRKNKTRKNRKNRKSTRKNLMNGGSLNRTYFGKVTDSSGKVFKDSDFSEPAWQKINTMLDQHAKTQVNYHDLVFTGFGGDKQSGLITIAPPKSISPMPFEVDGNKYTMNFDRVENEN